MSAYYPYYLESLCRRREWDDPVYNTSSQGLDDFTCRVLVNGREYQSDVAHESPILARENAARSAYMICRNFSVNGGMIARNGIIQGLPLGQTLSSNEPTPGQPQLFESSAGTVGKLDSKPESSVSSEVGSIPESHAFTLTPSEQDTAATSIVASSLPPHRNTPSNHASACTPCRELRVICYPSENEKACQRCRIQGRDCTYSGRARKVQAATETETTPTRVEPKDLSKALEAQDYNRTQWLLENHFETVASGEYAWIAELKRLGYSALDTTDELMEKAINRPWIFEPFEVPALPTLDLEYHQSGCVHAFISTGDTAAFESDSEIKQKSDSPTTFARLVAETSISSQCTECRRRKQKCDGGKPCKNCSRRSAQALCDYSATGKEAQTGSQSHSSLPKPQINASMLSAAQTIEYLCGLAGVRPTPEGSNDTEFGSVAFGNEDTTAIVSLIGPSDYSVVQEVLKNLELAAGVLQASGGCCSSFTYLYVYPSNVDVFEVTFSSVHLLRELCGLLQQSDQQQAQSSTTFDKINRILETIFGLLPFLKRYFPRIRFSHWPGRISLTGYLVSLAAQFLSLAFLSYTQAHCGSIRPFFIDKALTSIALAGHGHGDTSSTPPLLPSFALYGTLVQLTCVGEMTDSPVFAFHAAEGVSATEFDSLLASCGPKKDKCDLCATPTEILDTWGPGTLITRPEISDLIYAIRVGGGTITTSEPSGPYEKLHWSRATGETFGMGFSLQGRYIIGGGIEENPSCRTNSQALLREAVVMLESLGTFAPYWEIAERQAGISLQAGQGGVVALQCNQVWAKMAGVTRKAAILCQQGLCIADLESYFGVQVSICTGIARRVRLSDLLADVLPLYVDGIVTKPQLWHSLKDRYKVIEALRRHDLKIWLGGLDHAHQVAFETLVMAVLNLLVDTGIDRKGQHFTIACIQPNMAFRCFKIPCKKESYWTRLLADSEETATFAYVTTQCLEACSMKCNGPTSLWMNTASMLGTSVSCYEERISSLKTVTMPNQWTLRHSEAYLIGPSDSALFVEVDWPDTQADPRLLVSVSTIPKEFLYRFSRKAVAGKPRRLREMKAQDEKAEGVVILVG